MGEPQVQLDAQALVRHQITQEVVQSSRSDASPSSWMTPPWLTEQALVPEVQLDAQALVRHQTTQEVVQSSRSDASPSSWMTPPWLTELVRTCATRASSSDACNRSCL